jgi:PAS domain S-box-containing protein
LQPDGNFDEAQLSLRGKPKGSAMFSIWKPPIFEDEERTQRARAMHVIVQTAVVVVTLVLLTMGVLRGTGPFLRFAVGIAFVYGICISALLLSVRLKTQAASVFLVAGLTVVVTAFAMTAGGVHAMATPWYLIVIFGSGLLLGARAGFLTALSCSLLTLGMLVLEKMDLLPVSYVAPTPVMLWANFSLLVMSIVSLQRLASQTIRDALDKTRRSELRYRSVFEGANDAIFLMDGDRFIECNRQTSGIFGRSLEEILGKSLIEFSPANQPDGRPSGGNAQERIGLALGGQPQVFDWVLSKPDGSLCDAEVSLNRVDIGSRKLLQAVVRDVTARKRAERQLQASLQEKEILLKEIHHRVKNNLQVITSLLNLQSTRLDDEKMKDIFLDTQNRIRSMALIHEILLFSHFFGSVDLLDYCNRLTHRLTTAYRGRNVELDVQGEHINLSLDQAIPCGLILNELVSDAFKHASPGGRPSKIVIRIAITGGLCGITLSDDRGGIGEGPASSEDSSLGMELVSILVNQLEGKLTVGSGAGTNVMIEFPLGMTR